MKTLLKWLSTNQKSIAISIFVTLVLLLVWNLWTMINHFDTSYMYAHSLESNSTDTLEMAQQWAIRGQMGDILSGHFSALAFLAVALSVFLQNEANRQMKLSLVQQSEALEVQTKSLKAQLEELQQSREESKRQTEEFFISNIHVKLEKDYKLLESHIEKVSVHDYKRSKSILNVAITPDVSWKIKYEKNVSEIDIVIQILNLIYDEITKTKKLYPTVYKDFMNEFRVKLLSIQTLHDINKYYDEVTKGGCKAFKFFNK